MHLRTYYPTVVLSDIHLGTSHSKTIEVSNFLKSVNCDRLILNGDIIDGWHLRKAGTNEGGNLAASKIRNLECPSYEICLIDYGCGKFNRKIHIMEQYP